MYVQGCIEGQGGGIQHPINLWEVNIQLNIIYHCVYMYMYTYILFSIVATFMQDMGHQQGLLYPQQDRRKVCLCLLTNVACMIGSTVEPV